MADWAYRKAGSTIAPALAEDSVPSAGIYDSCCRADFESCRAVRSSFERLVNDAMGLLVMGCPKRARQRTVPPVNTTTKLTCLVRLARYEYAPLSQVDLELFVAVKRWCREYDYLMMGVMPVGSRDDQQDIPVTTINRLRGQYDKLHELAARGIPLEVALRRCSMRLHEEMRTAGEVPLLPAQVTRRCHCSYHCVRG